MRQERPLLRRLVVFVLAILVLSLAGLGLLLFRWWGERGAPPTGRLYVSGDFDGDGPLVVLTKVAAGNACYDVQVPSEEALPATSEETPPDPVRVCRGDSERLWVEDALLHLSVGARGVPRVSMAGLRARPGDWLGSLADRKRPHPRYPIRAYGVPATAARVVACSENGDSGLCLESHDRGGRLAIVRSATDYETFTFGTRFPVDDGDALWLGLVAFEVRVEDDGTAPALVLRRVDHLRPRRGGGERASHLGGDRRWLGRLWHVEAPDPGPEVPARFEVHPMQRRYTMHNLSRQRTNFEGEDVVQRLIDGGWLCLERASEGLEVVWRPLDEPGCGSDFPAPGVTRSAMADYQRARHGDLSFLAGSLVNTANAALVEARYLDDATTLPFAFDWRLAYGDRRQVREGRAPQPVPHRLWGVRFGVTRQIRQLASFNRGLLPTVLPRDSTGRHVLQVLKGEDLVSSVYLPGQAAQGSICFGAHEDGSALPFRDSSGLHHPLGSVAFEDDPRQGTWLPEPDAACQGCRLTLELVDGEMKLTPAGECDAFQSSPPRWGSFRLRQVDRGQPWLAATDAGTRRRHFAEELYLRGGLRPLLGDESGLSGVEAALREVLADAGEIGVPQDLESLELTIDGDLQLTAAAIVDALARRHVTAQNDSEGDRVSVTAAVLDAASGDLLAAVNWSRRGSERARQSDWARPTAWELGSGQADVLENAALLRRAAVGSTMKITGTYALLNNGVLDPGAEITEGRWNVSVLEAGGQGELYLQRGELGRPTARKCSTGPHYLPASGQGYTVETFVRRFAESCNNFFVLSGFRHASSRPARLAQAQDATAGNDELLIELRNGSVVLVQPPRSEQRLVERIRAGLAADFAPGAPTVPRSIYSVLFRLGFQPRFDLFPLRGEAPREMAFGDGDRRVVVPLTNDWFAPTGEASTPALEPGRDFTYLGVPSPGRLDKSTVQEDPAVEHYDGEARTVRRRVDDGRTDVQYSMLMIGQSGVEVSAVGLAALYAPAAREDGKAVSPCLFRANCGRHRAGARVLDSANATPLNEALRAVVQPGGTAHGGLWRLGLGKISERGWGGKTGTYQVERRDPVGMSRAQWRQLRAWACGVGGVSRPPRLPAPLAQPGSALGSSICEESDLPFNPAGVQRYSHGPGPEALEKLARRLEDTAAKKIEVFHSFVAVAPPRRGEWPEVDNPAEGIVVAVLVDRETEDEKSIAVQIAGELAAAVERWATLVR